MQTPARSFSLFVILLFAAGSALSLAWTPAVPQDATRAEEHEPLSEAMGAMAGARKRLKKALEAEDADNALAAVADFQAGVLYAKLQAPHGAETLRGEERSKFLAGFRKLLVEVLATSCDLETALLQGRFEKARAALSSLDKLSDEGHETFDN